MLVALSCRIVITAQLTGIKTLPKINRIPTPLNPTRWVTHRIIPSANEINAMKATRLAIMFRTRLIACVAPFDAASSTEESFLNLKLKISCLRLKTFFKFNSRLLKLNVSARRLGLFSFWEHEFWNCEGRGSCHNGGCNQVLCFGSNWYVSSQHSSAHSGKPRDL